MNIYNGFFAKRFLFMLPRNNCLNVEIGFARIKTDFSFVNNKIAV